MEAFIASQPDDALKAAYTEVLDGCLAHPDECEWYSRRTSQLDGQISEIIQ